MVEIHLLKLAAAFAVIIAMLWLKRPLWQAIIGAITTLALLYQIPIPDCIGLVTAVLSSWTSMALVVIIYLITFLQRMLDKRAQIRLALQDLDQMFNNRRINTSIAPLLLGLLPSPAVMIICGDIVKQSAGDYLNKTEQAFVASWFRHIPESTLPTYSGVLLMLTLTGVDISGFMLGMIVPVICLMLIGYFMFIRKIPKSTENSVKINKAKGLVSLIKHLWTLLSILLLILIFHIPVVIAVGIIIVLAVFIYRFKWHELRPMFKSAFELRMLLATFFILVFKEAIFYTGSLLAMPEFFSSLPIPAYMVFALLFFFGGMVSSTSGIIALGATLAFTTVPGAGMPLMVLLMCMCHASSMVSPTHLCLIVITEYFKISLGRLVRVSILPVIIFCVLMIAYYNVLTMLL